MVFEQEPVRETGFGRPSALLRNMKTIFGSALDERDDDELYRW